MATVEILLQQHGEAVAAMRAALARENEPLYEPDTTHDALWCLRFLLSHRFHVGRSSSAAIATLRYRAEHGLDVIRAFATSHPCAEWPGYTTASDVAPFVAFQPDPDRGPYVCVRHKDADYHAVHARPGAYEELALHLTYLNEWVSAACDAVTRRTGVLTKVCRLDDFEGFSLRKLNWRVLRRFAADARDTPDLYPQQLGALCAFHTPPVAGRVWRIVRPLMPARAAEKFGIYNLERTGDAQRLAVWIALEHVPNWLGGSNVPWPPPDATATNPWRCRQAAAGHASERTPRPGPPHPTFITSPFSTKVEFEKWLASRPT